VRHNVPGGWIDVHTEPVQGDWSELRVSSSGRLLPSDRVTELFEPFRRGGVDRTAQTGTGLGLSIVRAVVAAHGGELYAEGITDGGLSITVRLPAGG
jgi:hypothetical protein